VKPLESRLSMPHSRSRFHSLLRRSS